MFQTEFVSMYPWETDELGEVHGGQPGVVNEDGTEPGPISIPSNSGSGAIGKITEWWGYDGVMGGPAATHLRGSCACGWRGATLYPVDWDEVHQAHPYYDTSGPEEDWKAHVREVESTLVPLPDDVAALLDQLNQRVDELADREPLVALRAANILQRNTHMSTLCAATTIERDKTTLATVGAALGCSASQAEARLRTYRRHT
ncbi:hypothetical protein OG217_37290 (plasmid) [Streptomyces sp. NBC_01023]|uniref:hypothetical protein n=1 Tax=unclassified Streptomyces TaxID=2593676 RepID=UPI002F90B254|nr:hypothetical protein OG217_37290 [Streptomyces sp. NBC_01023]